MQLEPHILYYEHISCQTGDIEEFLKENLRDNVIFYGFFIVFIVYYWGLVRITSQYNKIINAGQSFTLMSDLSHLHVAVAI